jgi:hypothetical protein
MTAMLLFYIAQKKTVLIRDAYFSKFCCHTLLQEPKWHYCRYQVRTPAMLLLLTVGN